jgi:hypothetical protein
MHLANDHDISAKSGAAMGAIGSFSGKNSLEQVDNPPAKAKTVNKLT